MNSADAVMPATPPTLSALDVVKLYHDRSKHRFEAYAQGPGMLDWDAQPAAFRRYEGAPTVVLPLISDGQQNPALHEALERPFAGIADTRQPPGLVSLGALLQLALGITAWKTLGPDRWAVRANPSSGNLHPVEAWLITRGIEGLVDGVHHYRPEDHVLELRARDDTDTVPQQADAELRIALSTAMWREAWKYGERGFRYCQLDVGHATSSIAHAAAVLGWSTHELRPGSHSLSHRLGLDRDDDFPPSRHPQSEREEAEILLAVGFDATPTPAPQPDPLLSPTNIQWFGKASQLDPFPRYRWPLINDVARATRRHDDVALDLTPAAPVPVWPGASATGHSAADIMLARRSAQRFDSGKQMSHADFIDLLQVLGDRLQDGRLSASVSGMMAVLFVHRVDTLTPGIYLLAAGNTPPPAVSRGEPVATVFCARGESAGLVRLRSVGQVELHRLARSLHCHQDIASNACLALGLIAPFDDTVSADPAAYRDLLRAAGQTGQALYLLAERLGLRGTGIGCFFDDPVHKVLGLSGSSHQTLYHFTIGLPIDDSRIESAPAYPADRATSQPAKRTPTP